MKYIFVVFCSIFVPIFVKEIKPKCLQCKFFRNTFVSDIAFGKCAFFPKIDSRPKFVVAGFENIDYFYCSTARNNNSMCGKVGRKYETKRR